MHHPEAGCLVDEPSVERRDLGAVLDDHHLPRRDSAKLVLRAPVRGRRVTPVHLDPVIRIRRRPVGRVDGDAAARAVSTSIDRTRGRADEEPDARVAWLRRVVGVEDPLLRVGGRSRRPSRGRGTCSSPLSRDEADAHLPPRRRHDRDGLDRVVDEVAEQRDRVELVSGLGQLAETALGGRTRSMIPLWRAIVGLRDQEAGQHRVVDPGRHAARR